MRTLNAAELAKKIIEATDFLRGRMDGPAYLDILSAMLLLRWASDQPGQLTVPLHARWEYVADSVDSLPRETLGEALGELVRANLTVLGEMFWDLDFTKILSHPEAQRLISHFNDISLQAQNLKFDDVVGQAYDRILGELADMIGKREGGFFTPRSVIKLMVRLARPKPGQSVCDPFAGSGGTLTHAAEYVAERTGQRGELNLYAQDLNIATCRIAGMNLLLHGLSRASVRRGNTLTRPFRDTDGGHLRRFDQILTVPPFSVNYRREEVSDPERMRYGWTPENGRKADLMFVQHVLSTLKPDGIGIVITPQGVLLRGGAEGDIRRRLVMDGRIAAVIGIGPNVFHGTSVPACVLVLRGSGGARHLDGGVLFINAEREITTGRSRNHLDPRHVEKIVTTFRMRRDIPHFSRVVSINELDDNEFNLNIGRYVDPNPTPRVRLDSRALLFGGVPWAEVKAQRDRFRAFGIDVMDLFVPAGPDHLGFPPDGSEAIAENIRTLARMSERRFLDRLRDWSDRERVDFAGINDHALYQSRHYLIDSFRRELLPMGILDEHQLTGVFVDWWAAHRDDLRELSSAYLHHDAVAPEVEMNLGETIRESMRRDLIEQVTKLVVLARQELVETYRSWADRYGTSLQELNRRREESEERLRSRLRGLGYDWPLGR